MAILVELRKSEALSWSDDTGDVAWTGYGDVYFRDADDSETKYLSLDGQAFDHYWDPYVISFSAPTYQTKEIYGGFVQMDFGTITLSPDTFLSEWPPPKYATIDVYHTVTTEDAATRIFNGNIYLESYSEKSVTYNLYAPTYAQDLLQMTADIADAGTSYLTGVDYNGDDVALPRAFGQVDFVQPIRLPDDSSGYQVYHLGGLGTTSDAKIIESYSSASFGTKTTITCTESIGWSNGTSIKINGSTNFSGSHVIESVSGTSFVIPVEFPTDNSESIPIHATAFIAGSFIVFEDGVPKDNDILVNGNGTFSVMSRDMNSTLTISGTGANTTLTEITNWAKTQFEIGTYNDSNGRGVSPDVAYWATSQMPVVDFVSNVCAFFTHYFYVKADQLYLCDMFATPATGTFDEYEYFDVSYNASDAVKQLKSTWTTREAKEGFLDDEVTTAKFVKDIENEVVITADYPWGQEIDITPYHYIKSNVTTALDNILLILSKDTASIGIPIDSSLPDPGKKLTFSDNIMPTTMSTYIWARSLQFDFENDKIKISGEGVIS